MRLPKISFIIPTYNAQFHLPKCLESIRKQNYPQEKIEIIIADGGSTDQTTKIAEKFRTKIILNLRRLAEYGVQAGMLEAKGDLVVIFAADNELYSNDWLRKVLVPFRKDAEIAAVWGRLISGENDSRINKYFELIQSDPFCHFMNKNLDYYLKDCTAKRGKKEEYYVFRVERNRPLVWGANGLTYRRKFIQKVWNKDGYLGDNDAFQCMIEKGHSKVACFPTLFIYHHHVTSLRAWINKWRRNYRKHFLEKRETRNLNWVFTPDFKPKLILWLIYSLIPIFSLSHSLYLAIRDRNIHWFYHPVVCFLQTLTYMCLTLFSKKGWNLLKETI